tara:strand:+ start:495 stop:629 length:135 start_codon:yes stop_codon:yes gene_type:complete
MAWNTLRQDIPSNILGFVAVVWINYYLEIILKNTIITGDALGLD